MRSELRSKLLDADDNNLVAVVVQAEAIESVSHAIADLTAELARLRRKYEAPRSIAPVAKAVEELAHQVGLLADAVDKSGDVDNVATAIEHLGNEVGSIAP